MSRTTTKIWDWCRFQSEVPKRNELANEIEEMKSHVEVLNMKSVFSHNDLLLQNIVVTEKQGLILRIYNVLQR